MIRQSLKGKIIIPAVTILTMLFITMIVYSSVKFANFANALFIERIGVTAKGLKNYLIDCERASRTAAYSTSTNVYIVKAIRERDTKELIRVLIPTLELYNIDF